MIILLGYWDLEYLVHPGKQRGDFFAPAFLDVGGEISLLALDSPLAIRTWSGS
jgi:hypothetical protein